MSAIRRVECKAKNRCPIETAAARSQCGSAISAAIEVCGRTHPNVVDEPYPESVLLEACPFDNFKARPQSAPYTSRIGVIEYMCTAGKVVAGDDAKGEARVDRARGQCQVRDCEPTVSQRQFSPVRPAIGTRVDATIFRTRNQVFAIRGQRLKTFCRGQSRV